MAIDGEPMDPDRPPPDIKGTKPLIRREGDAEVPEPAEPSPRPSTDEEPPPITGTAPPYAG